VALIVCHEFYGQSVTVDDRYLYYLPEHLWVEPAGGDLYRFGVSHAGAILVNGFKYLEYAVTPGEALQADDSVFFVETYKAMINVTSPVAGIVTAVNDKLAGEGVIILAEQYYSEFLFAIECAGLNIAGVFLTAEQYLEALLGGEGDHCGAGARVMRRNR
jgi:glycine cleavage system H protein